MGIILSVLVVAFVWAVTVRASCWLFNKLGGEQSLLGPIHEPSFISAAGIALLAVAARFGCLFGIVFLMSGGELNRQASQGEQLTAAVLAELCGFVALCLALKLFLPTSFGRAFGVAFICAIICGCIAAVFAFAPLLAS